MERGIFLGSIKHSFDINVSDWLGNARPLQVNELVRGVNTVNTGGKSASGLQHGEFCI